MSRFNRLLRIDLSRRESTVEEISSRDNERFLGGKGLATAYFVREVKPGTDPLGEDNRLYIALGPLNATGAPASSRFEVVTKSPLTGIYLDCNSGGHFGNDAKATGFDLIVLQGKASSPVVLFLKDEEVFFLDAGPLWGMDIYASEREIRRLLKDPEARVLSLGPAGENLVRFASLSNDFSRNAARGGVGAVMGSKNVKALAVKGTKDIQFFDPKGFRQSVKKAKEVIFKNPWVADQRKHGTPRAVLPVNENGIMPVSNFTRGKIEGVESLLPAALESYTVKNLSCGDCPVACSKGFKQGRIELEGPEYETIGLFGPNLGITDPLLVAELNHLCNLYGLDTITAGALLGAVLSQGIYKSTDTENPAQAAKELLTMIVYGRGIGATLAKGLRIAGEELGISYWMPHIKGMGLPAYDPRASYGTALAYMTADRGACHLRAWPLGRELSGLWAEADILGRVKFVKEQQEEKAAEECLILCQFPYGIGLLDPVIWEMLYHATGENWNLETLKLAGERTWNLSRVFNNNEGITRKDDYLPERFSLEGIAEGPLKGRRISREDQDLMLDHYYDLRQWSREGIPERDKLKTLGIEEECEISGN